jgi:hypothetical protein
MTSKERMMRALNREKPDRLPATCHRWQKCHRDTCLGGIDDLEAFARFGMDAQAQCFGGVGCLCSCCDHFFDAPPEHIRVFADAARECTY